MLCILMQETDPYFCLAAEEFLLKNHPENIFMVWQCHNTVVVGKHQNALAEVDFRYVQENGIRLARRISGGGTVFHDMGNINFSVMQNIAGPQENNFTRFTGPIVGFLGQMGVTAVSSGRNDLQVSGLKISGNAQHIYKNRVLHHGTLLFDADLENLGRALRVVPEKYTDKGVASNRSPVTNLAGLLKESLTVKEFMNRLVEFRLHMEPGNQIYSLPAEAQKAIRNLSREKYETGEWQYGYSPAYTFQNNIRLGSQDLHISLAAEKGCIRNASLSGDYYPLQESSRLEQRLINQLHLPEGIREAYRQAGVFLSRDLLYAFF